MMLSGQRWLQIAVGIHLIKALDILKRILEAHEFIRQFGDEAKSISILFSFITAT